jgi:hypothetical protein
VLLLQDISKLRASCVGIFTISLLFVTAGMKMGKNDNEWE